MSRGSEERRALRRDQAREQRVPSSRELARLRHEYSILRELDSPGVVKTYGLESFDRGVALILQDLHAPPLSDLLRARRLDTRAFLTLGSAIAGVLDALHQRRVLHKDIKPQNILVNAAGEIWLLDFGLAVRLAEETPRALRPDASRARSRTCRRSRQAE